MSDTDRCVLWKVCEHCGTNSSPKWHEDDDGCLICNDCFEAWVDAAHDRWIEDLGYRRENNEHMGEGR